MEQSHGAILALTGGENKTKIEPMVSTPLVPSGPIASGLAPSGRIRELLDDLPETLAGYIRIGVPEATPVSRLGTGIEALDALLMGGFPRGGLAEITGPLGSGRTSLALTLLAETTRSSGFAAVVDAGDAFDPGAAEDAGVELARVLWARAPALPTALRCTERLLEARGFALVVLDPGDLAPARGRIAFDPATLQRLQRSAASSGTALVCVGNERRCGNYSSLTLRVHESRPHFVADPDWLEGMQARIALERSRTAPPGGSVLLQWKVSPLACGLSVRAGPPGRRGATSSA